MALLCGYLFPGNHSAIAHTVCMQHAASLHYCNLSGPQTPPCDQLWRLSGLPDPTQGGCCVMHGRCLQHLFSGAVGISQHLPHIHQLGAPSLGG